MRFFILLVGLIATSCQTTVPERKGPTPDQVRERIRSSISSFKTCYEENAEKEKLSGKITVTFQFGSEGKVLESSIVEPDTTLKHEPLQKCLLGVINDIEFPKTPPKVIVVVEKYPFVFEHGPDSKTP